MINIKGGGRTSNLELYRIICMMMILSHHFAQAFYINDLSVESKSVFLNLLGMWGKTGINCFLLITGYFMCTSSITLKKFIKFILWIYTYRILLYIILLCIGYESLSMMRIFKLVIPVWGFNTNFLSCYIGFWLTIPFWNILIQNMTKKQHLALICLILGMYSVLGTIPDFYVAMNYVTWFGIIYLIGSYIRLYPNNYFDNKNIWIGVMTVSIVLASIGGICLYYKFNRGGFYFVGECNRILAVVIAVSSFILFKNLKMAYRKSINIIGGSTFGVLLIHANSDAMRQWLWKDTVDCINHYFNLSLLQLILFCIGVVLTIFFTCILVDRVRIRLIEEPFFRWYDKRFFNLS